MCKILKALFNKPQRGITSTQGDETGTTEPVIIFPEPVETGETTTDTDNDNNDESEAIVMTEDRLEVQRKIIDFAREMFNGQAREVNQIAVHCTATAEGRNVTMSELDSWHKARGFSKQKLSGHYCGYHFVIALDGTIMCGRDLREVGAHVSGYNSKSIGVCYVGGLDASGKKAKDTRTDEQKDTLIWLISELKHVLNIRKVQGHRDYSPDKNGNGIIESFEWIKDCPCFNAIPEYKDL